MWQPGDRIHFHYEVLRVLQGSMGVVYVVRDLEYSPRPAEAGMPRIMAAKALRPELAQLPALKKRFLEEAKLWIGMLPHRHVVRAYFSDLILDTPYIFSDYIAPGLLPNQLAAWIESGLTPPAVALYLTMGVAAGLQEAYDDGIVAHGDIKPANLLIDELCDVKIADWGLSRPELRELAADAAQAVSSRPNADLLLADSLRNRGTPGYAAPELARGGPTTRACDIFSLGVTTGEMLSGSRLAAGMGADAIGNLLAARYPWRDGEIQGVASSLAELLHPDPEVREKRYSAALDRLGEVFAEMTELRTEGSYVGFTIREVPALWRRQSALSLMNIGDTSQGYDRLKRYLAVLQPDKERKPLVMLNLDHGEFIVPRELVERQEAELAAAPDDPEKILSLLSLYDTTKDLPKARALYDRLLALGDPSPLTLTALLPLVGSFVEGSEQLRLADLLVALAPNSAEHHMARARVCADLGLVDEALAACREAERHGRLGVDDLVLTGHLLLKKGEVRRGLCELTRAVRLDRKSGLAWYNRGVALRKLGKLAGARRSFRAALENGGPAGAAHNHLGSLLLEEGNFEAAAAELQAASVEAPKNPKIWFNLGQCMFALGHLGDALRYYDIALSIDPAYELAKRSRDEVLAQS